MNEDLHNNNQLPITAEMGWEQMQGLLNKHLPLHKQVNRRNLLLPYCATALLLFMLLFTSLLLNENNFKPAPVNIVPPVLINNNSITKKPFTTNYHRNKGASTTLSIAPVSYYTKEDKNKAKNDENLIPRGSIVSNAFPATKRTDEKNEGNLTTDTLTDKLIATINAPTRSNSKENSSSIKNVKAKSKWNLYSGIGINMSGTTSEQNLSPYPIVEAKYSLTPRIYVSAGLAPYAPVTTNTTVKSKAVYINDTLSNVRMYNEKTTYYRFHYADIPLTIGANITKQFSVETGIQLSVLLNKKSKKTIERYDFQMNRADLQVFTPLMVAIPAPPGEYDMKVHAVDYRFLAGMKYNINKVSAGFTYQRGLSSVIKGSNNDGKKNDVFAFSLLYRIK